MTTETVPLEMWVERARVIEQLIRLGDYYIDKWEEALKRSNAKPLEWCYTKSEVLKRFQYFWELLPDSPEIRRPPFEDVCTLAEEYCFGAHGDDEAANRTIASVVEAAKNRGSTIQHYLPEPQRGPKGKKL